MVKELIPRPLPAKASLHLAYEENASLRARIAALEAQLASNTCGRKGLTAKLEEIRARVEKTMCQTWSSDGGDQGEQGRISRQDFDTLILSALSPAPEAQQEPVAWTREEMLPLEHRFMFLEVAKEGSAVSCTPLFTRPAEQAVTEAMVEAGAKAIVACRFEDESEPVTDYDLELSRAALKAAMEAGR